MNSLHIYDKSGPHAAYYKVTLALTIILMSVPPRPAVSSMLRKFTKRLTFLITATYANRLKKRGGTINKNTAEETQGYIPVPGGQTPVLQYSVPPTPGFKQEPYTQQQPYAPPAAAYVAPQPQAYQTSPSPVNPPVYAPPPPQQQYQYQQQYMTPPQQPPVQQQWQ